MIFPILIYFNGDNDKSWEQRPFTILLFETLNFYNFKSKLIWFFYKFISAIEYFLDMILPNLCTIQL